MLLFLCLKIFFVRIIDVSLGTVRTIFSVKGKNLIASLIGFAEITVWFLVVKEALNTNIKSLWIALSYAGGYAVGTFVGTTLSNKLIKGKVSVQVIMDDKNSINKITDSGYAFSKVECTGMDSKRKQMLFIEVDKRHLDDLKKIINTIDRNAFMVINETKYVVNGFFK